MSEGRIPFHKPDIDEAEISAVTDVLRSGWLTTGEQCRAFEAELAAYVGARHAVALNSCTAALHLALAATGLQPGDLVLVPALTFAATAEVVWHLGGVPLLIDCEPDTLNIDVAQAARAIAELKSGRQVSGVRGSGRPHAIVPVHYGGQMADVDAVARLARQHGLRVVEDAAHALPAFARGEPDQWRACGTTSEQTCFSFYANKTITTGEGGMLVTDSPELADRVRCLSLHGLSADAWKRFAAGGSWRYQIVAPGFKYNLTDIAAALGRAQLRKATALCEARTRLAGQYQALLGDVEEIELPTVRADRRPSWHLYPLRLHLPRLTIGRDEFIDELSQLGIATSVHWTPLHLHPLYRWRLGLGEGDFPVVDREWKRLVSLPLYPSMTEADQARVAAAVRTLAGRFRRRAVA